MGDWLTDSICVAGAGRTRTNGIPLSKGLSGLT
jgi:hypothetical protein